MPVLGVTRGRGLAAAALLGAAALAGPGCDGDDERPPAPPSGNTTSSGPGGGGQGGAGGAGEGGAGQGGAGAGGAGQGGGGSTLCGDGQIGAGEACDGGDLGGQSCQSLGFESGTLACTLDCYLDTSACSSPEQCQDGIDNDLDGGADCADQECAAACGDACAVPVALPDPATVQGVTDGHAPLGQPASCTAPGDAGPAVVYQVTAAMTGVLDLSVVAGPEVDLDVSVRTACASAAAEIACANEVSGAGAMERLTVPVTQGETVYVAINGPAGADFLLSVASRIPMCGDGAHDAGETCDDGNTTAGDGCSDLCVLESTEVEPNGSAATASAYTTPFFGAIDPTSDVDFISVNVPSGTASLKVETGEVDYLACLNNQLDNTVEILDAAGANVLASDDDSGTGRCATVTAPSLAAGNYLIRVRSGGLSPAFPYRLDVTLIQDVCGDGSVTPGEQCDDGNTTAGDGCSASCQIELDEAEPNNTAAEANSYAAGWVAAISPAGDVDVVAVSVPGPTSTLQASVGDAGTGQCMTGQLDSFAEILGPGGSTVLASDDDNGPGYCSTVQASGLAAGTYFVRVQPALFQPNATFLYSLAVTVQ